MPQLTPKWFRQKNGGSGTREGDGEGRERESEGIERERQGKRGNTLKQTCYNVDNQRI